MALPLIMGLLGSTLGAGTALGAVGAGALASGVGRFLETGDLEEGLKTGATSFLGGKVLGSVFGGAGDAGTKLSSAANTGTPLFQQSGFDPSKLTPDLSKFSGTFGQRLAATASDPVALGQATLAQATVPPPMPGKPDPVEFENRQAGVPQNLGRRPPKGYRPGIDPEFDYGITPNFGVGLMSEDDPRYMGSKTQDAGLTQLQRVAMENPDLMYPGMSPMFMNMGGLVGLLGNQKVQDALSNVVGISLNPAMQREANNLMTGEFTPEGYSPLTMADVGMNEGGMVETDPIEKGFDNNVDNVPLPDATQQNQIGMLGALMRARRSSGLEGLGMDIRRRVAGRTDGEVNEFITDVENMAQERFDVNLGQSATPTPFSGKGGVNRVAVPTVTPRFLNPSMFGNVMRRTTGMKEGGMPDAKEGSATEIMAPNVEDSKELQTIIIRAARALQGATENPEKDIQLFVEKFGMQALNDLRQRVASGELSFGKDGGIRGMISGEGDGMSDSIEAEIVESAGDPSGSGRPLQVANNEYVVAADVVSDIGNGSSEAGAAKLDRLMKDVRLARHGTTEQPDEKDMMSVMKKAIS